MRVYFSAEYQNSGIRSSLAPSCELLGGSVKQARRIMRFQELCPFVRSIGLPIQLITAVRGVSAPGASCLVSSASLKFAI